MKKVIITETDRYIIFVDIVLYLVIALMGFAILAFPDVNNQYTLKYLYVAFFIVAFFAIAAYFTNRRKGDYEFLFFAVINVVVGAFALANSNFYCNYFILGCSILIYSIANTLNKGFYSKRLESMSNPFVVAKFSITLLLSILGIFVAIRFYFSETILNEVLGYYFIAFGLLSLIEPLLVILINNDKVHEYLCTGEEMNLGISTKTVSAPKLVSSKSTEKKVSQRKKTKPVKKEDSKKKVTNKK